MGTTVTDDAKISEEEFQKLLSLLHAFKDEAQSRAIHPRAAIFVCGMLAGVIGDALVEDDMLTAADAKAKLHETFNEGLNFMMDHDHSGPGVLQ